MSQKEINDLSHRIKNLRKASPEMAEHDAERIDENFSKKDNVKGETVLAELVAGLCFGLFLGFAIDSYFDTKPLFMIILVILGLAGSFYNIYKAVR